MSKRLIDRNKVDIGLVGQSLDSTNATGKYYDMQNYRRFLAVLVGGALAAAGTAKLELLQATDAAGTGAKGIPTTAAQTSATVTANTGVTAATLTMATVTAGSAVTINGLTFTAHATVTTKSSRQFSISGDDTADAAELVSCINDATYGVPGVMASSAAGVITLVATNPGEQLITITDAAATVFTAATTQYIAYVEADVSQLDIANGFRYIAAKVTTTATSVCAVLVERGEGRFSPDQQVGAYAVI